MAVERSDSLKHLEAMLASKSTELAARREGLPPRQPAAWSDDSGGEGRPKAHHHFLDVPASKDPPLSRQLSEGSTVASLPCTRHITSADLSDRLRNCDGRDCDDACSDGRDSRDSRDFLVQSPDDGAAPDDNLTEYMSAEEDAVGSRDEVLEGSEGPVAVAGDGTRCYVHPPEERGLEAAAAAGDFLSGEDTTSSASGSEEGAPRSGGRAVGQGFLFDDDLASGAVRLADYVVNRIRGGPEEGARKPSRRHRRRRSTGGKREDFEGCEPPQEEAALGVYDDFAMAVSCRSDPYESPRALALAPPPRASLPTRLVAAVLAGLGGSCVGVHRAGAEGAVWD